MWDVVGEGVKKTKVVEHLVELRNAAAVAGVPVFYSPHHFSDYEFATWKRMNVIDKHMFDRRMSRGPGWGADVHPDLAPDESTFILSPHIARSGFWGVDISIQFRQRDIETIVIAGASASLCMTSNLRHAEARDYEVLMVKDATTGPANEEVQAAVANHGLAATEVVTTDEITDRWVRSYCHPGEVKVRSNERATRGAPRSIGLRLSTSAVRLEEFRRS